MSTREDAARDKEARDAADIARFRRLAELDPADPARAALRGELVADHVDLARNLARKFDRRGDQLEDLVQVATIGLIKAVDRFEVERGNFYAFAIPTIMGELRRHFRDTGWAVRVPRQLKELHVTVAAGRNELSQRLGRAPKPSELAEHLGLTKEQVYEALVASAGKQGTSLDARLSEPSGDRFGYEDERLTEVDNRRALGPLLAELPEREQRIIVLRFFRGLSQADIARRVGVSQMQVSRLLAKTLERLRAALGEDTLAG
ncbi:SigB/SigF/SigG family RNA polymerase sigma factor [Actinokineospora sp. PR83]|uniref:SigB/SigF/SigG family RNA polymerase sigma factor n=1 Tax=Actinokineospora sp. PR83 TaxID=2884908 RepID=UPI001F20468A|nr:SigB/SigF/SigG family RNA polymerase sigma factor [Actinokineospora sp. PR83]MCG8917280.1 SigB/SigF/SigG family RNA polymerase sigma factor [Actinokineospora sp. PR83]